MQVAFTEKHCASLLHLRRFDRNFYIVQVPIIVNLSCYLWRTVNMLNIYQNNPLLLLFNFFYSFGVRNPVDKLGEMQYLD